MKFDKNYTKYWSSTVNKSVDGTIIAGSDQVKDILDYLELGIYEKVLDLGCSFGRMHEVLMKYSRSLYGIDADPYAVEQANNLSYEEVRVSTAEQMDFNNDYFDLVFCWAVFDVVDHIKGLGEINRVLKPGGKLLITGKNDNYFLDDQLAYKAEKNAFLKGFPNRFTNLSTVTNNFNKLGYQLDKLLIFPRRGDLGKLNFNDESDVIREEYIGYEYLIFCHKVTKESGTNLDSEMFELPFSKTARKMANRANFSDIGNFFQTIGID